MGKDCSGRTALGSGCLKVLGVLRVRGRGYCVDGIEDIGFISGEVIRFFYCFNLLLASSLFGLLYNPPISESEIFSMLDVYEKVGLPGCLRGTDCVNIRRDREDFIEDDDDINDYGNNEYDDDDDNHYKRWHIG